MSGSHQHCKHHVSTKEHKGSSINPLSSVPPSSERNHKMDYDENTPFVNSKTNSRHPSSKANKSIREVWIGRISICASLLTILICAGALLWIALIGFWGKDLSTMDQYGTKKDRFNTQNTEPNTRTVEEMLQTMDKYTESSYDEKGRFILKDYDTQSPFADFLPALAGYYGKPLYAFYVNRGQGIASFGFRSKNFPIQEFHSANQAYQQTPFTGFRTFLQISPAPEKSDDTTDIQSQFKTIEPFDVSRSRFPQISTKDLPKRNMFVGMNEMQLQEVDTFNGIETNVTYFILPEEDFGAFVKRTTITNILPLNRRFGKSNDLSISMLDGLAKIEPAGGEMNALLKNMGQTLEAWMGVYSPYNDTLQMPFYRLSMLPSDTAFVTVQEAGHWCLSVYEGISHPVPILLPIVFDPQRVFDGDTSMTRPLHLYKNSISYILQNEKQYGLAKTASAFAALQDEILKPQKSLTVTTYYGKAESVTDVPVFARRLLESGFAQFKEARATELVQQITMSVETKTAIPLFDGHVQQMFLDNALQGGMPGILGEVDDEAKARSTDEDARLKVFHLFSRGHGGMERDSKNFVIEPTFFSNGPGSYRDVVQSRRNDVIFNPRIGSFNVKTFLSFIQSDGYEPLEVQASVFTISDIKVCQSIGARAVGQADGHRAQRDALIEIINAGPFRPGQLFTLLEQQNIELIISHQEFIDMIAAAADIYPMAVYESGFWADHWTYYIDLIRTFIAIYPDWEARILFDNELPYFFSPATVKPRSQKYVLSLSFDGRGKHVRQLNATTNEDFEKIHYQRQFINKSTGWYDLEANWQHDSQGNIFTSNAFSKLFLLAAIKFSTRDPYGIAIEYEGGKPGWNDANNGLVGMIGSGTPELNELAVLIKYILSVVHTYQGDATIPTELNDLVTAINNALDVLSSGYTDGQMFYPKVPSALFNYWDTVASAREQYRNATKITFSGVTEVIRSSQLKMILSKWLDEIDRGIQRAYSLGSHGEEDDGSSGLVPTYFSYNVTKWIQTGEFTEEGHSFVIAREMIVSLFPLFLEGPARSMKTLSKESAKMLYEKVRVSTLRDKALGMYTVSASLKGENFDVGRETAFASGWLENQSIWLQMSYKFYLELLRHQLYDEFFDEVLSGGMLPFMNPDVYGRSLMECSSFLVSSVFEDPKKHGRGHLPRLSGSTSEFLSIWVLMFIGPNPFFMDDATGDLGMQLVPSLPRWMFADTSCPPNNRKCEESIVTFKLFGSIDVTYHHRLGDQDLFNTAPSRYSIATRDGRVFDVVGNIKAELADKIRRVVFVATIDAFFE